ncbi:hypothetical protein STEG23_013554 [Scotinomys teguina]
MKKWYRLHMLYGGQPEQRAQRTPPPSPQEHPLKRRAQKTPPPPRAHHLPQSPPRTQEQRLTDGRVTPRTQEQQVTLRRRAPRNTQSPSEEEDPGAASHTQRKSSSQFLRPRCSQPRSEEEDPGAPRQYWNKRPPLPPIQGRNGKTSMKKYIQQHEKQDITRIKPSSNTKT